MNSSTEELTTILLIELTRKAVATLQREALLPAFRKLLLLPLLMASAMCRLSGDT